MKIGWWVIDQGHNLISSLKLFGYGINMRFSTLMWLLLTQMSVITMHIACF